MIDYAYPIRQSKHHKRSPQGHISRSSNGRLLHRLPCRKQDLSVHSQVAAVPPFVYTSQYATCYEKCSPAQLTRQR